MTVLNLISPGTANLDPDDLMPEDVYSRWNEREAEILGFDFNRLRGFIGEYEPLYEYVQYKFVQPFMVLARALRGSPSTRAGASHEIQYWR